MAAPGAGDVVGFALFLRCLDEAELLRVAVAPEMRRQGVGAALVAEGLRRLDATRRRAAARSRSGLPTGPRAGSTSGSVSGQPAAAAPTTPTAKTPSSMPSNEPVAG